MSLTKINVNGIEPGTITAAALDPAIQLGGPKITGIDYPDDDTAALPAGGQTVNINGSGFASGATIYIDGSVVNVVSFISESQLQFIAPAKATGLYPLYVVNPDGGTAIGVPGMVYSGTPTWTTASGSLGTPYETASFSVNLSATGDGALTYAVTTGSSLPTGLTLASNGTLSGTVPVTNTDTTYTFNVDVTDSENQSTTRQFSVTYRVDVVTWSDPADGASFSWVQNSANSTTLTAASAAGKSVSFTVESGSLPSNVTISGNLITGTPNTAQSNTSVVIKATAADTARFANRTLYFTIPSAGPTVIGEAYGGGYYGGLMKIGESQYYLIVSPKDTGQNTLAMKTDTSSDFGNTSDYDGYTNTNTHNDAAHPAFQWARSLTIGGYTDWYIPAPYEFLILYYNLKPTTDANTTGTPWGWNPFSVSPYTPLDSSWWKVGNPAQTPLTDWQAGGAQALTNTNFSSRFYTSMQAPNLSTNIIRIDMRLGTGYDGLTPTYQSTSKTTSFPVRAIRKVLKT